MNRRDVTAIMGRLNLECVLVAEGRMDQFMADIQQLGEHNMSREEERAFMNDAGAAMLGSYGIGPNCSVPEKPFTFANGIAFIPIQGALVNRLSSYWGYVTGYNFIRAQMNAALDDPDVKMIVFDVNSYGGEAAGCFELAREIAAGAKVKRILAVVNSNVYSAAYMLVSGCSIYLTPSGGAGSIGVLVAHVDYSGAYSQMGIKVTLISAPEGGNKTDGNPYEALPATVKARIQSNIDKSYSDFVTLVADNRGLDSQAVRDTKAQTFRADEALDLALIDKVQTPTEAVAAFLAELGVSDPADLDDEEDETMSKLTAEQIAEFKASPEYAATVAAAVDSAKAEGITEGAKAAATRMNTVLASEEASTRPALTKTLLSTSLSADEIVTALKVAAPEAKVAEPAPVAKTAEELAAEAGARDTLTPAMAATGGGAGVKPGSGEEVKPSRAAAALAMAGLAPKAGATTIDHGDASGIPRFRRN